MTANGSSNTSGSIARKIVVYRDFWKVFINVVQIYGRIYFEGMSHLLFYIVVHHYFMPLLYTTKNRNKAEIQINILYD